MELLGRGPAPRLSVELSRLLAVYSTAVQALMARYLAIGLERERLMVHYLNDQFTAAWHTTTGHATTHAAGSNNA